MTKNNNKIKHIIMILLASMLMIGVIMGQNTFANARIKPYIATIEDPFIVSGTLTKNSKEDEAFIELDLKKDDILVFTNRDDQSKKDCKNIKIGITDSTGKTTWAQKSLAKLDDTVSITAPATGRYYITISNTSNKSIGYNIEHDPK